MNTNGTGGGRHRPRVRLTAADMIPKKLPVLTIVGDDGEEHDYEGYVWGKRVPGLVEARVLDNWNRDRDEEGRIADPVRRREVLEEAVVGLVEGITLRQLSTFTSIELIAILEDLDFLKPSDETDRLLELAAQDDREAGRDNGALPPDSESASQTSTPTSTSETSSPESELSTASV